MTQQVIAAPVLAPSVNAVDVRGASLRAVYMIWKRDLIRYTRDRMRLLASLAQPVLFLVVFGTGLSSSLRGAGGGIAAAGTSLQYVQFIYPGVMGMAVLFSAVFGAMSIVWDREFGFLKEVLVAPIHRSSVAIGKSLGSATQSVIQGAILLVLAPVAGVRLTVLGVLELIPLLFILAFALSALGVAIAARMRSMQAFQVVVNFLMMPLFFLAGSLFPLGSNLPAWLTVLTRLDPVSYGIDAMRRTVLTATGVPQAALDRLGLSLFGQPLTVWVEVVLLVAFGLAMLALAILGFRQRD
ncbi:MAG: ABC transporter permease [Candidatus Dormibacteraeota bacterium]|nr:ABC transporter permease [Candidatus Dormibacteraeota bacterium]MBV8445618.1 ABC transporter permease [Candidatus Dormibacteraeota bacterium]